MPWKSVNGGIENHRKEIGQHRHVDAFGKGLAFGLVLLPVAFHAVAEDLMKEDAGRAPGKNRGPYKRIGGLGVQQRGEIRARLFHRRQDLRVFRELVRIVRFETCP